MDMDISSKLAVGSALISELDRLTDKLNPYDDKLPEIIKRAVLTKLRMKKCYDLWDQPPALLEQLERIDSVIKKLELIQNKCVTDM